MQEIWRGGYEANSVKATSEMLGITRSSYYNAFGSREELFKEALEAYFSQSPDRALFQDISNTPVRRLISDVFKQACLARASDGESRGCMAVNSLCELASGPHKELGTILIEAVLSSVVRFETLLDQAVTRGELRPDTDVRGTALALQSLLIGVNTLSKAVREEEELWLAARTGLQALGIYQDVNA